MIFEVSAILEDSNQLKRPITEPMLLTIDNGKIARIRRKFISIRAFKLSGAGNALVLLFQVGRIQLILAIKTGF